MQRIAFRKGRTIVTWHGWRLPLWRGPEPWRSDLVDTRRFGKASRIPLRPVVRYGCAQAWDAERRQRR